MDYGLYLHLQKLVMKSNKIFFLLLLCMFFLLWCFSEVSSYSTVKLPSILGDIFLVILGVLLMKFTLSSADFKTFILLYGGVWLIYILLKIITVLFSMTHLQSVYQLFTEINKFYIRITFINTPLPFIFYWITLKTFSTIKNSFK